MSHYPCCLNSPLRGHARSHRVAPTSTRAPYLWERAGPRRGPNRQKKAPRRSRGLSFQLASLSAEPGSPSVVPPAAACHFQLAFGVLLAEFSDGAGRAGREALLTPRERDVFVPLAQGLNNREIAEQLGISVKTVDLYRGRVMKRLQAGSLAELVGMAIACGAVEALGLRAR